MRILGGCHKGRRIKTSKKGTRPTKAIVREAIFDMLGSKIVGARVLDIFAGSGALGIEAICRGAQECVFIEKSPKTLLENIKEFSIAGQTRVLTGDFRRLLGRLADQVFTVVFIDPPYKRGYLTKTLTLISKYRLLHQEGIIVAEHSAGEQFKIPGGFSVFKEKRYGDTGISFISAANIPNNG